MKPRHREQTAVAATTEAIVPQQEEKWPSRRKVLAGSAAVGTTLLTGILPAAAEENVTKKNFIILHTNDMHSAFIGMGPASDYTPRVVPHHTLARVPLEAPWILWQDRRPA